MVRFNEFWYTAIHVSGATTNAKFHDKQQKGWLSKFAVNLSKCIKGDKAPINDTFGFKEEDYASAFVKVMGKLAKWPMKWILYFFYLYLRMYQ